MGKEGKHAGMNEGMEGGKERKESKDRWMLFIYYFI